MNLLRSAFHRRPVLGILMYRKYTADAR
jgi:hypothetical protein